MNNLAIGYTCDADLPRAEALAARLGLDVNLDASVQLIVTPEGLWLKAAPFSPLQANFVRQNIHEYMHTGLIKACRPSEGLRIVDATAGWGKDAALLASFGASVTMLERNPIMAALLEDALDRAKPQINPLPLSFVATNAIDYLTTLQQADYPDVIYLDPMHPERTKSALVKKNMQILQQLIGPDEDALTLLQIAREKALERVVVKWPQKRPPLIPPQQSFGGKTVRFDIYYS